MTEGGHPRVVLDGASLTLEDLARIARDPRVTVDLDPEAFGRVERASLLIAAIARDYREHYRRFRDGETEVPPVQDYGVTTGFGEFKDIPVEPEDLERLQVNLLLSHLAGAGVGVHAEDPANYYPAEVVRAVLALRLNTFLKGHSGIRPEMLAAVRAMLNRGVVPLVPLHGSVGSSGDLCPLAHLFAVLVGEGPYYLVREPADLAPGWRELRDPGRHLAADLGLEAPAPSFKEGLALINGATFSAAILALAVVDAEALAGAADVAAALSLEAACGCARAFDPKIHAARNQEGQAASAATLRALLAGSRLVDSAGAVQDPYSLRCAPAVHGASRDAIAYARRVAEREANAATDNPLFFPGEAGEAHSEPAWDLGFRANWPADYRGSERASYSACNFHGQPLALAADFLAIALAELADISERRTQLLLDAKVSRNLPANLVARRGVNSGLMVAQYTAAGLVSENKVLAHPASVDSIPTAAGAEDHNAMATIAARKARTVAAHCEAVLAIELMVAAQAVDWRAGVGRPPRPMAPAGRGPWPGTVPSPEAGAAAGEAEAFRAATAAERREAIAGHLGRGTAAAYRAIRRVVAPLAEDRPVAPDLLALRRLLAAGTLLAAVEAALGRSLL